MEKAINKTSGVYRLQNLITGKFYIGSSNNLYRRYYSHFNYMKKGNHDNCRIKEDAQKYGSDSFVFGVVEYCSKEIMIDREQFYFEQWKPQYNVWKNVYSGLGRDYTPEQLIRMRTSNRGPKDLKSFSEKLKLGWIKRKASLTPEEFYKKHSLARKGILHSEEAKKKMSQSGKGRIFTEEHKRRISESRKGKKLINGKLVKVEKTKKKISQTLLEKRR